jgi:hypothetical protein
MVMESMIMKPTIALLPDNVREQLNRRATGGPLPALLRADPLGLPPTPRPRRRHVALRLRLVRGLCGPYSRGENFKSNSDLL